MDELTELHVKGELATAGFLKETYNHEKDDLVHELTDLGKLELRQMFKDVKYRQEFLKLAILEADKHPGVGKEIIQNALSKIKEYSQ